MTLKKGNNMNKKLISLIAGAAIVAAATGCSETATSSVAGTDSSAAGTSASEASSAEASSAATEELSGTLSMNGSTSMEKVIKAVNGAFMEKNKGVTVNLNLTGSGTGIQEASEGKCDIGNSSRKLKNEEAEKLDATVVGLDGIALVVNPVNKLADITLEDLAKVYSGEITNWKELGGDDKSIVVIGREDGSGTRDGFESIVMGDKEPKYAQELESTGSVINAVATTDGAIGYASLANVDETVKALKIGGVEATEENVKSGAYEVQRPFICATLKGSDNKLVKAYLDFILSEEGQALVLAQGAVPVK
ncbi:phosphate binding protein [[Eubacterium] siraeum CAG:80]|uniref:Phosphate-binding protein n=1 Tax=[Eubacterium] siraeum CAG:80 TaxID=1263080 RepID=R6R9N1_9FIRM|nr:phosphate binding protein [[Eubacterium] siraeum CAG:80]